ncbi:MAG: hypothetical protein JWR44_1953 [Hymenobacter sp.]|jgi:predicted ATP-dependent endonuclease of OLD family|nr:hypothetical protein [Hymenobacter sp.]
MNEQLVVKNFGPIKDATVDFKRVTVFIGPTGGGKSTLAKLAAIYRDRMEASAITSYPRVLDSRSPYKDYNIDNFFSQGTYLNFSLSNSSEIKFDNEHNVEVYDRTAQLKSLINELKELLDVYNPNSTDSNNINTWDKISFLKQQLEFGKPHLVNDLFPLQSSYIPSDRIFIPSIEYSWAGLMRDDIGLPKVLLNFANSFSLARKNINQLEIPFLNVKYLHINGRDLIKIPEREAPLMLHETASGIQSVTPLLVLLEHLSRNTEQAQSFIIEEPELNLYPTAQQGLLNWLVEKCAKGENDLTITTHSPYILSHLNLLLYAYQVAEQHPDRRAEVAAIVPEASWINPKELACYQVEGGGVQSLVDDDLGLIDNNELDALSGDAADAFDNLIRLSKAIAAK